MPLSGVSDNIAGISCDGCLPTPLGCAWPFTASCDELCDAECNADIADAAAADDGAAEGLAVDNPDTGSAFPPAAGHKPRPFFLRAPESPLDMPFVCGCVEIVDVEEADEFEDSDDEELERWTAFRVGT